MVALWQALKLAFRSALPRKHSSRSVLDIVIST